jgi:hypothetical protein
VREPSWRIGYASAARRDLHRLDPQIRARVIAAIERAAAGDPRAAGSQDQTSTGSASASGAFGSDATRRGDCSSSCACCQADAPTIAELLLRRETAEKVP